MALAMLLEWFEDFHTTSRAAKKAKERDDNGGGGGGEMEADPRTCGVEVQNGTYRSITRIARRKI